IVQAAHMVSVEGADAVVAGGVELISLVSRDNSPNPSVRERYPAVYMARGVTAEIVAKRYAISREHQDEYALLSQQRTARAQNEGAFDEEIAPIAVTHAVLDKKTGEAIGEEHRQ